MAGKTAIEEKCIQTIRFLSAEGVQAAKSGHPGMPMGMAAAAFEIWMNQMRHNPANPKWDNRDRFVLSAGHGSMLLYSMLHLTGYDLPLDELKNFRQLGSLTPGHPEYGHTPGVEVTTGPLGQGIANSVGMAIAQKYLAEYFNRDGFDIFDYKIYSICGDGCLQEGVSGEASSLAGHLGLGNIILLYDDNSITIDGETSLSFTEDVAKRYEAYNWHVQEIGGDGTDLDALAKAIDNAKAETSRPSIIKFRSHIGFGSPNFQDTHTAHGAPLGDDEIKLMKKNFGWDPEKSFEIADDVKELMGGCTAKGKELEGAWNEMLAKYADAYPELAKELNDAREGRLPINIDEHLPIFEAGSSVATRKASGETIGALMPKLPLVLGGSADLTPSNNTHFKGAVDFQKDTPEGRYIRFGVREHAMGAILNGINVSGLLRCYGGTFLVFSDYMRGALRVAALSGYPSIFVFTHDSIGVGEDGPTHQPVETVASLRAFPNMLVFRPADAVETTYAWKYALENKDAPVAMCLTRQNLPTLDQNKYNPAAEGVEKGAYALNKVDNPDVLLLATGSEVQLAVAAGEKLEADGIMARVVSMPSWELFEKQSREYKDSVLPPSVTARVGVEAGVDQGWYKYLGLEGKFIGMNSFGASAPQGECFKHFGITAEAVEKAARELVK
ncbi:Transketolase 1 [Limihaloglobus sulfuriphilus]|uniref:Transketolase n=1 Tax=Limihaloglobus sulfuriphilus TaxID=1851148 RepID=A0A1Q2MJD2_9BACT|nr:transketolase [Limihaloglobus sulfuriphilus]AQQ72532.1 Transketolase 1 [Limihaloglobus sulfuriphilus]